MSAISTNLSTQRLDTPNTLNTETTDDTAKKTTTVASKHFAAIVTITYTITITAMAATVSTGVLIPTSLIIGGIALAVLLTAITDPQSFKEVIDNSANKAEEGEANDELPEDVKAEKNKEIAKELLCPGEIHAAVGTR